VFLFFLCVVVVVGKPCVHNIFLGAVWLVGFLVWIVFGAAGWLCWLPQAAVVASYGLYVNKLVFTSKAGNYAYLCVF
jgi:hypothetical protein